MIRNVLLYWMHPVCHQRISFVMQDTIAHLADSRAPAPGYAMVTSAAANPNVMATPYGTLARRPRAMR